MKTFFILLQSVSILSTSLLRPIYSYKFVLPRSLKGFQLYTGNKGMDLPIGPIITHSKIIHLVRHAQGYHNVAGEFDDSQYLREDLEDANLTDEGERQCQALRLSTESQLGAAELLITSPLNRTIQTALNSFPFLLGKIPWVALDCIREQTGKHPCDRRGPIRDKRTRYPMVDFQYVKDDEDKLYGKYPNEREPFESVMERCQEFLEWLSERPEKDIVVVSHGLFIETLVHDVLQLPHGSLGKERYDMKEQEAERIGLDHTITYERQYFNNCEIRTVKLDLKEKLIHQSKYHKYFD